MKARVRVERQIGRASGATLTIDHLTFTISEADLHSLAAQLVRVLAARPAAGLDPAAAKEWTR